jgi:hypothetical protein
LIGGSKPTRLDEVFDSVWGKTEGNCAL